MSKKKRFWLGMILAFMLMLQSIGGEQFAIRANADGGTVIPGMDNYCVTLLPGKIGDTDVTEDPVVIWRENNDGGLLAAGQTLHKGRFYHDELNVVYFVIPDCPESFLNNVPHGSIFNKWIVGDSEYTPGQVIELSGNLTLTAMWLGPAYYSLSTSSYTITHSGYSDISCTFTSLYLGGIYNPDKNTTHIALGINFYINGGNLADNRGNSIPFLVSSQYHWAPGQRKDIGNTFSSVNEKFSMSIYIDPEKYNEAVPGTYNGTLKYDPIWNIEGGDVAGESGTIALTLIIPSPYNVTLNPGTGMTKTSGSGALVQSALTGAMTDVVFTANEGYYFPETYSASSNGISVTRNSDTQITVSGTPTADVTLNLPAATARNTDDTPSGNENGQEQSPGQNDNGQGSQDHTPSSDTPEPDQQSGKDEQATNPTTPTDEENIDNTLKNATLSKPKAGKKSFTLKWKKQTQKGIKGYEIQYATDKKFTKNTKTASINKAKTTSKTIKKLKSGKKYYVRIRTFTKKNGEKVYSKWSKTKSVKVK